MSSATPPPLKRPPPRRRPSPGATPGPGKNALKEALAELSVGDAAPASVKDDGSEGEWLFKEADVVKGPVAPAVIVDGIESGVLDASTPVAREMGQWFPLADVPHFQAVLGAAVERRRAEAELLAARTRRRRTMMARVVLMASIALVPSAAGAVVGYGVAKARPWDDTQEWLKRPPPLVDLPPKPSDPPKVSAKKRTGDDARPSGDDEVASRGDGERGEGTRPSTEKIEKGGTGEKGERGEKADRTGKGKKGKGDDKDQDEKGKGKGKDKDKDKRVARADTGKDGKGDKEKDKKGKGDDDDGKGKADGKGDKTASADGAPKLRTLDQDQIMDGLKKGYGGFKTCIGTEMKRNPDVPGRITMAFSVANDGKAINFKLLERQVRTGPLADCMEKVVGKLRWPTFYGERKYVEFPLNISKKR